MPKEINLRQNKVQQRKQQVSTYGTQTPLSSTAVERGSTRWLNGSTVVIEGLLDVTGRALVSGLLDVTGTFNGSGTNNLDGTNNLSGDNNLTGPTEISGSLDVTGPTTIDGVLTINGDTSITGLLEVTGDTTLAGLVDITGNTTITGDLDVDGPTTITGTLGIEGVTTLKNDLNVTTGGKIKAGNLEIEPANGGQINFLNGSLSSGSNGALLNNTIGVELLGPKIDLRATNTNVLGNLKVDGTTNLVGRVTLGERLAIPNITNAYSSAVAPNVYIDANGFLYRTTWIPT